MARELAENRTENLSQQQQLISELRQSLRPGQRRLADWRGGAMAVSAVPGAGKSHSLSIAAALVIARDRLHAQRQLLIVTYTRSAATSIKTKIRDRLRGLNLPQQGFVVQTLHGLALNVAQRHPEVANLDLANTTILAPSSSHRLLRSCVEQWLSNHPQDYQRLLEGQGFDGEETERLRRQSALRTEILPSLAHIAIREAKSSGLSPQALHQIAQTAGDHAGILVIAAGLYQQYERLLRTQNLIDYDDMILAALRVLAQPTLRRQWQTQIYAVFEDEAQDSSPLQERLINLLATIPDDPAQVNLVRVGDPNQAINSTFTPADPLYFNEFCHCCDRQEQFTTMDQAGRSSRPIMAAANYLLQWAAQHWSDQSVAESVTAVVHPHRDTVAATDPSSLNRARQERSPFRVQAIHPVSSIDPQPEANPKPEGQGVEIYVPQDIWQTVAAIQDRAVALLNQHPQRNAAILIRENRQGRFLASQLASLTSTHGIPVYEVNEVERHSQIPAEMLRLLQFIDRPHSPDYLKGALEVLAQRQIITLQDFNALAIAPEQFLYPVATTPPVPDPVRKAGQVCRQLLRGKLELPHYQLITFLGLALQYSGAELATNQKLAERLHQQVAFNGSLKAMITQLREVVSSERFEAVEEENDNQYMRAGQLTIITMHKAKGLDWDYVFLPFLHQDLIPGQLWVPTAAKFLGDFTLADVARAQIRHGVHAQAFTPREPLVLPSSEEAWQAADGLKQAEEYRLLYVAMTRAKRLLWLSAAQTGPFRWSGFSGDRTARLQDKPPSPAFTALLQQFPGARGKLSP